MKRYILSICTFAALCFGGATMTSCSDVDDVVDLVLGRVLSPTNLSARIANNTDIVVSWDAMEGATGYEIEAYEGSDDYDNITPAAAATTTDNTYTITGLMGETDYYVRVRALDENNTSRNSKWVDIMRTTNPEQNLNSIGDDAITSSSVTLTWTAGLKVDKIVCTPTAEETAAVVVTYTLSDSEIAAGSATVTGLVSETEYHVALMLGDKTRGYADFTTLIDFGDATPVYSGDDLASIIAGASSGDKFILVDPVEFNVGKCAVSKSISISGYKPSELPTIKGCFILNDGASLSVSQLKLDGSEIMEGDGNQAFEFASETNYESLTISNCEISNYKKGFFYVNVAASVNAITIDNCLIHDIICDGGDMFDSRKGFIKSFSLTNSTIWNSCASRDFIRMDDASSSFVNSTSEILVDHCTLDGISNNSSRRFLYVRFVSNVISFTNNMVTNSPDCGRGFSDQAKTSTPSFKGNNYFNTANLTSDTSAKAKFFDNSGTEIDPQYVDAANGDFTIGNESIKYNGVGDPRWSAE